MNTFVICERGGNLMHKDDDKFLFSLLSGIWQKGMNEGRMVNWAPCIPIHHFYSPPSWKYIHEILTWMHLVQ